MSISVNQDNKNSEAALGVKNALPLLIPLVLGLFLFISSVAEISPELGIYNGKRLFQIGIIPILFLIAVFHKPLRTNISALINQTPKLVKLSLLIFFLLGAFSAIRVPNPAYSLVEVGLMLILVLLIYMVAGARFIAGQWFDKVSLVLIVALGIAVILQETMGLLANWSIDRQFSYDNMFIYFAHPRFFNQLQTWSIPMIAALPFVFTGNRKVLICTFLILAMQWYLLLASGARGSFISLSCAILLVGLLSLRNGKKWLTLQIGGAFSGLLIYSSIVLTQKLLASGGGEFVAQSLGRSMVHTTGRTWIWGFAWDDAVRNPWFGAGPARFACNVSAELPGHPHNIVMQLLAEWGFPATILVLSVVIYLGWILLRRIFLLKVNGNPGSSGLQLSLTTALVAAAIHSLVSGLLVMPASSMMAALIGGWLLGIVYPVASTPDKPLISNTILVLGLVISLFLTTFSASEIRQFDHRTNAFEDNELQMPRFWNEGRICRYLY